MRYFSEKEAVKLMAAEHNLKMSTSTLRSYRTLGVGGPPFSVPIRAVEYSEADLVKWINERRSKTFTNSTAANRERTARVTPKAQVAP